MMLNVVVAYIIKFIIGIGCGIPSSLSNLLPNLKVSQMAG